MASKIKRVAASKVHVPRNNPSGRTRQPLGFVNPTRIKPKKTRGYAKVQPVPDPASEGGIETGFGMTGLTGES